MIKNEREAHDQILVLDAGNSILGGWERDYGPKARMMVGAMNRMGYDALTIGAGELRLGPEELLAVMSEANFPFLSANITQGTDGPLLAQPHIVVDVAGRRVAIIGVTAPEATDVPQLEAGQVGALDPIGAVREQVEIAGSEADVIIVLSYLGLDTDRALAQQVEGIDLIVGGRSAETLTEPIRESDSGTVIVQAGDRGEWLGIVDLELDQRGRVVGYRGRGADLVESIAEDRELGDWLKSVRPTPTPTRVPSE